MPPDPHAPGPLPPLAGMVADDPFWCYPSRCGAGVGVAHLRVWHLGVRDGHLAVVSETGLGSAVTDSTRDIYDALAGVYPGPLTLLEHWPAAESASDDGEHLDIALVQDGRTEWRRIWPTSPANPSHDSFDTWMREHGHVITAPQPG